MNAAANQELEDHKELSAVAAERITWEAAAHMAEHCAAEFFLRKQDKLAEEFRDFSAALKIKATDASQRQDVLLKKLGYRQ